MHGEIDCLSSPPMPDTKSAERKMILIGMNPTSREGFQLKQGQMALINLLLS
jgi:hypothetical protein